MLRFAMSFAGGVLALHLMPDLPGWPWLAVLVACAAMLFRVPRLRIFPGAFVLGFLWSQSYALLSVPPELPVERPQMRLWVEGQVVSLVERSARRASFVLVARTIEDQGALAEGTWRLRLSWHDPADIATGDVWRLPVRLRAAHGYATPGAWDYEGWLYWQGIRYTGYVDPTLTAARLPDAGCCVVTRLRSALASRMEALPLSDFAGGVLRALVLGDRSRLDRDTKGLFAATGTSHLMAVSGLHIGLLAGIGFVGVGWLWRRIPTLCSRFPARIAGACVGICLALGYALMAGMALPTQRALIMLLAVTGGLLLRRHCDTPRILAAAAVVVLIWHPPSVVSAGFWLSFGAVLVILAVARHTSALPTWRIAVRVQFALSLALWPVLAAFGMPGAALGPFVNLVAVPLFGVLIVPFGLLGSVLLGLVPDLGSGMLQAVGGLLDLTEQGLYLAADGAAALPLRAHTAWPGLLAYAIAAGMLLAPHGVPMRWAMLPLLAAPWLPLAPRVPDGDFIVHVLDVGQGLSVLVETRGHALLFDTGPEFPSGFSTAEAVVVPFLGTRGIARLDRLVVSHGDKDHAGGLRHVLRSLEVGRVESGEPQRIDVGAALCRAGERWRWDGVSFEFVHPPDARHRRGNDASCVLRVVNPGGSLLLTGDIEEPVERRLVVDGRPLDSDVVVAPHHGSRSSSSLPFVAATQPGYVVYTAGWANRYGFPAPEVVRRWHTAGARGLNTATSGAIGFRFSAIEGLSAPSFERVNGRRFWWHVDGSAEAPLAVSSGDRSRCPPDDPDPIRGCDER